MPSQDETLEEIERRIEQLGDLPIFSASVNRIRQVSASPDSNAIALSQAVTRDANLTAKILRLANSSYYNRGRGKIGHISRAVVLLGFTTIKNMCLTLKLIDTFQADHPTIDMNKMLVDAYLAAGFVREIAIKCGVTDVEEAYTCALLHNLGEIAVAYFLPERYAEMLRLHAQDGLAWADVETRVLGGAMKEIGQHLASSWEFPDTIVKTMETYEPGTSGPPTGAVKVNRALASLASSIVGTLHLNRNHSGHPLHELLGNVAQAVGLEHNRVQAGLLDSFRVSCELASEYGLGRDLLMPNMEPSGDELRDRLAGRLAYFASNYRAEEAAEESEGGAVAPAGAAPEPAADRPATAEEAAQAAGGPAAAAEQLAMIREITALIAGSAYLNDILMKVLEALHRGAGFTRAVLILASPDHRRYAARVTVGAGAETLKQCLDAAVEPERDLFSKILLHGNELLVEDVGDRAWRGLIAEDFAARTGAGAFTLGALRAGVRPIGLFYADNGPAGRPITPEQCQAFNQFVAQARLAIQLNELARGVG